MFDLYLITPALKADAILERARAALGEAPAGRVALQLRAKHLADGELRALAEALRELTCSAGAPLLINADLALAQAVGADGVQLPERGPGVGAARVRLGEYAAIGASRHDLPGVEAAARDGASFITLSPVFAVAGKGEPLGVARLASLARASRLPAFALGGISAAQTASLVRAGAHGVAVIREVFESADPGLATARLLAAIDAGRHTPRAG